MTKLSEYDREVAQANEQFGPIFDAYYARPITELAKDEEALKVGQRLFAQNCALCHGSDAGGQRGFPSLSDDDWLYGGSPEKITETLLYGRKAMMPGWIDVMGEQGIKEVTAYVLSLSNRPDLDAGLVSAGKDRFGACAACHGMDGKGMAYVGPNIREYDDALVMAVLKDGKKGSIGAMPSFAGRLNETQEKALAAYIRSLGE